MAQKPFIVNEDFGEIAVIDSDGSYCEINTETWEDIEYALKETGKLTELCKWLNKAIPDYYYDG